MPTPSAELVAAFFFFEHRGHFSIRRLWAFHLETELNEPKYLSIKNFQESSSSDDSITSLSE